MSKCLHKKHSIYNKVVILFLSPCSWIYCVHYLIILSYHHFLRHHKIFLVARYRPADFFQNKSIDIYIYMSLANQIEIPENNTDVLIFIAYSL